MHDPAQGAEAILNGGRSKRNAGEAILHVDHAPALFEVIQEREHAAFFRTAGPAAAVNVDQGRIRPVYLARQVKIELGFPVVSGQIGDVGDDTVLVLKLSGKRRRIRKLSADHRRPGGEPCGKDGDGDSAGNSHKSSSHVGMTERSGYTADPKPAQSNCAPV